LAIITWSLDPQPSVGFSAKAPAQFVIAAVERGSRVGIGQFLASSGYEPADCVELPDPGASHN
jgi:hypothetical protein